MTVKPLHKKRFLTLFIGAVLLLTGVYYVLREDAPERGNAPEIPSPQTYSKPASSMAVGSNTAQAPDAPAKPAVDVARQGNSGDKLTAWDIALDEQPSIPLPEGVVEYEPVAVDMDSPIYPAPGQGVILRLPEGEEVNAWVKSSNENPNGDYSWRGYLEGHEAEFPVVMTYGANSVFATITTPKGSYTMESVNGSGWIYKNPSEFELSAPGKNDFINAPDAEGHVHD